MTYLGKKLYTIMTVLAFTFILLFGAFAAGLLGSLTGLGGGVVVIPLLTLCFGIDFHYAVGAALVASIATSSGSGSAYVKEGITNIRLGMLLEIATTIGAVIGAAVAVYFNNSVLAVIFGLALTTTALAQRRKHADQRARQRDGAQTQTLWRLSFARWHKTGLSTHQRGRWVLGDGVSRLFVGHPRHWFGCTKGDCDGWLYESTVQGEHHNLKLYDWCDGLCFSRGLHSARQHCARHCFPSDDWRVGGCAHWCALVEENEREFAPQNILLRYFGSSHQYDLYGFFWRIALRIL